MTDQAQFEFVRGWLAHACGVAPAMVTDAHVRRWMSLWKEIRGSAKQSEAQARGARHLAYSEGAVRKAADR